MTLLPRPRPLPPLALLLFSALVLPACDGRTVTTFERHLALDDATQILLDHGSGDLVVSGASDRTDVLVVATLHASRPRSDADDRAIASVEIGRQRIDDSTMQIVAGLRHPPAGYALDVELLVPDHIALELTDDSGDLVVENLRALVLDDGSGDTVISEIAETVDVTDGSGDLVLEDIGGDVTIDDDSGDLVAIRIGGHARIRDGSGDIVASARDGVDIEADDSGDVVIR